MRRVFTLITLLCACLFMASFAYAKKRHHARSKARQAETSMSLPETSASSQYPVSDLISPDSLLHFAQTLLGTPYREASSDPASRIT